jgi:hypothetical protein
MPIPPVRPTTTGRIVALAIETRSAAMSFTHTKVDLLKQGHTLDAQIPKGGEDTSTSH